MPSSVWPYDTFLNPKPPIRKEHLASLTCFVATPYKPEERWNDFFLFIENVAENIGTNNLGVPIACFRADSVPSSGIVHSEMWESIRIADFIICDISGENGNVMVELGVAAAWRRKEHVIILRDNADKGREIFDIVPARYIEYEMSWSGLKKLEQDLSRTMLELLATIPLEEESTRPVALPFNARLDTGTDTPALFTPDMTHRRMRDGFLEFGAPLSYRHSWMCLSDLSLARVHVRADMKLTLSASDINQNVDPNHSFIGVMVRGQSYFANFGHLVLARRSGLIALTVKDPFDAERPDREIGSISKFDIYEFTNFDISIDDMCISINVSQGENSVQQVLNLIDLPHVFASGRVIFIAGLCRAGIRNIEVEAL